MIRERRIPEKMTTIPRDSRLFLVVQIFFLKLVCGVSYEDSQYLLDSNYINNSMDNPPMKDIERESDFNVKESDKFGSDSNILDFVPSRRDKYAGIWLRYELPYSHSPEENLDNKKVLKAEHFIQRHMGTLSSDANSETSQRTEAGASQTSTIRESHVSQAPGILLFLIDWLDSALRTKKHKKFRKKLDFENYPSINLGSNVSIDTVSAVQELMLKFLEWGAFIATDLLFQLVWPV